VNKLDALLARIKADVIIRRTKSGNPTVEGPKQRAAREQRERGGSIDPALRALINSANVTAKHYGLRRDPYENFLPIAHAPLLQRQVCRCCAGVQVNVAAELLHLRGRTNQDVPVADVWIRRSTTLTLPIEEPLWAATQSVTFCAACIETQRTNESSTVPFVDFNGQLSLIH